MSCTVIFTFVGEPDARPILLFRRSRGRLLFPSAFLQRSIVTNSPNINCLRCWLPRNERTALTLYCTFSVRSLSTVPLTASVAFSPLLLVVQPSVSKKVGGLDGSAVMIFPPPTRVFFFCAPLFALFARRLLMPYIQRRSDGEKRWWPRPAAATSRT